MKPRPDLGLAEWLHQADEDRLFLSVVTLAELRAGAERLAPGRRRTQLERWIEEELPDRFEDRLLPVDRGVADRCGRISARASAAGRPIEAMDAFIAATAEVHQLTLVTRNVADFEVLGVPLVSPWTAPDA